MKVRSWPSQVPVRESSFVGAFIWNRTGAPLRSRVGWEWMVHGRAGEGTVVKTENKMASMREQFASVLRDAGFRLCVTDEGVRRHTSWCRQMSSVDICFSVTLRAGYNPGDWDLAVISAVGKMPLGFAFAGRTKASVATRERACVRACNIRGF